MLAAVGSTLIVYTCFYSVCLRHQLNDKSRSIRPQNFEIASDLVSIVNSILTSALALRQINRPFWIRAGIMGRSEYANCIIGLEVAYLLLDTVGMLVAKRVAKAKLAPVKMVHHILFGAVLLNHTYKSISGREKGVYIVNSLLLMNASTPLLNYRLHLKRWALNNPTDFYSRPKLLRLQKWVDFIFIGVFFLVRPLLIVYVLWVCAKATDRSMAKMFLAMPLVSQICTGLTATLNSVWWLVLLSTISGEHSQQLSASKRPQPMT